MQRELLPIVTFYPDSFFLRICGLGTSLGLSEVADRMEMVTQMLKEWAARGIWIEACSSKYVWLATDSPEAAEFAAQTFEKLRISADETRFYSVPVELCDEIDLEP